jgi:hypothetical protein
MMSFFYYFYSVSPEYFGQHHIKSLSPPEYDMTTAMLRATTKITPCMSDQQTGDVAYQLVLFNE